MDERYGTVRFAVADLPMDLLKRAIMDPARDSEVPTAFGGDFDAYHCWYRTANEIPRHRRTDPRPVILSSCGDEDVLQDGWHRFHRYVQLGMETVPAIAYAR